MLFRTESVCDRSMMQVKLKYYFKAIAKRKTLSDLNHKRWKDYIHKKCSPEELQQLKNDIENP